MGGTQRGLVDLADRVLRDGFHHEERGRALVAGEAARTEGFQADGSTVAPGRGWTWATTTSPHCSSCAPITAASSTAGSPASTSSIDAGRRRGRGRSTSAPPSGCVPSPTAKSNVPPRQPPARSISVGRRPFPRWSVEAGLGRLGRWTRPVRIAATIQAPLLRSAKASAALAGWSERLPGSPRDPDPDGRSLVIAVARDGQGRPLAHGGPLRTLSVRDDGSLVTWAPPARHSPMPSSSPVRTARSPPSASTPLGLGAADAGVHGVDGASLRRR